MVPFVHPEPLSGIFGTLLTLLAALILGALVILAHSTFGVVH